MKKITENTKVTLTLKQLKALVKEGAKRGLKRYEMGWSDADKAWMVVYAHDLDEAQSKFENMDYELEEPEFAEIEVPQAELDRWDELLDQETVDFEAEDLEEDSTVFSKTVKFENGYWAEVKVCTGQDGAIWSEAVLFTADGNEVSCTDPDVQLSGNWEMYDDDSTCYMIEVIGK